MEHLQVDLAVIQAIQEVHHQTLQEVHTRLVLALQEAHTQVVQVLQEDHTQVVQALLQALAALVAVAEGDRKNIINYET